MPSIKINVRPSTGQIFQVEVDSENTTVQNLKQLIGEAMGNIDGSTLKLVFSGRILKNEDLVNECKITAGSTVHVVRSGGNKAAIATTAATSSSPLSSSARQTSDPIPQIPPTPSPSTLAGLSSASPFGEIPNMDPEVMRQMMDSPFMQNLMGNTELGHVISDPAFLRQSMEMMRNPELMREMQRNNDRALSNIEAIPGGFNHLRRMYNTFQSPMESAMNPNSSSDEANNQRLARALNVESLPENSLNTQALPNPWAAPADNQSSSASNINPNNNTAAAANPFAALGGSGVGGTGNPLAALLGGAGGSMFPFGGEAQQQQQQQQQQTTQQQQTPFWADPNFIQASIRLQQAMMAGQQAQNNNTTNNTANTNQQQNLLQQMMMGFPAGGFGGFSDSQSQQTQQQSEPLEVRFRDQLAQLEEMGFSEKPSNVRALLATGGDVQAAIEYLLSM
ncbi:hypothetical protein [Parasitella parasitica]|uniref:Ubiquilin n=1 Tax=Parasitella parasitica TaxID=35722 RepID=A0A0B7N249_9FUNG|nr:hypothetical protein [Parasitella parasitica]